MLEEQQQAKKEMTAEQKKKLKAEKDVVEAEFMYAIVDGTREKLGNFRSAVTDVTDATSRRL